MPRKLVFAPMPVPLFLHRLSSHKVYFACKIQFYLQNIVRDFTLVKQSAIDRPFQFIPGKYP